MQAAGDAPKNGVSLCWGRPREFRQDKLSCAGSATCTCRMSHVHPVECRPLASLGARHLGWEWATSGACVYGCVSLWCDYYMPSCTIRHITGDAMS